MSPDGVEEGEGDEAALVVGGRSFTKGELVHALEWGEQADADPVVLANVAFTRAELYEAIDTKALRKAI